MTPRTYLDFDLQIDELDDSTFRSRVLNSPAGQAEASFDFPFSELELENFFLRIGRLPNPLPHLNTVTPHSLAVFHGAAPTSVESIVDFRQTSAPATSPAR